MSDPCLMVLALWNGSQSLDLFGCVVIGKFFFLPNFIPSLFILSLMRAEFPPYLLVPGLPESLAEFLVES